MIIYSVVLFVGIVFGIILCWFLCPKDGKPCLFGALQSVAGDGTCGTCSNGGTCDCTNGVTTTTISTGGDNCRMYETECDGVCVDLFTSSSNCGICGNDCRVGYECINGYCVPTAGTTTIQPTYNCAQMCANYASIYTQHGTAATYTECRNLFYDACFTKPGTFQLLSNNCCCWYC